MEDEDGGCGGEEPSDRCGGDGDDDDLPGGGEEFELSPLFREDTEGGVGGGEDFELPLLQDGEGGGLGDCSDDGGGEECDGGGLPPEGEGGLEDDESSESEGGVDLELEDGGGLDHPFESEDELEPESELESLGGGALELESLLLSLLLLLPLAFSSLDEELGDGAIPDMLSFSDAPALLVDPSWYYVPLLRKSSSCFS